VDSVQWLVGSLLGRRTIVLVLVLVHVHDLTFAYTSSCTYNVYRCAVKVYDLPASRASGEKVDSGQWTVGSFLGNADCSTDITVCARLLSKVGTALRSGPPVVAGNQNCFDSGFRTWDSEFESDLFDLSDSPSFTAVLEKRTLPQPFGQ
jgi:hypothetical protein